MAKGKYQKWLLKENLLLLEGWARDGLTDEQIAKNMGISVKTLFNYKTNHLPILQALKKGKEVVDYEVENALLSSALEGNTTAQIFWLKNRRPDKWRDKQKEETDTTALNKLVSFGTKFASDNWMHKVMGIQLGLTDSYRFKLPENTDGTGYWKLTIYALGYEDYTVNFQITSDNLPAQSTDELDKTELQKLVDKANALNENDYTVDSWKDLKTELDESVDLLANARNQASINEQVKHLTLAINSLVKKEVPTETTPTETTPTETTPTTTTPTTTKPSTTTPTKPLVKKTTVSLARTNGSVYVKGRTTVKATIKNGKGKTTYKSNNTRIAKVSSTGVVTGVKKGIAVITVTNNRVSRTFKVTVKNPTLNRTTLNLKSKKNYTLKVQGKIGKVTFKSSNTKVATVNAKGKVVAKKKGNATITVKANGITLKCKVKVK